MILAPSCTIVTMGPNKRGAYLGMCNRCKYKNLDDRLLDPGFPWTFRKECLKSYFLFKGFLFATSTVTDPF